MQSVRKVFLQGLFVVLPIALAYWVLDFVYGFADGLIGDPINDYLTENNDFHIPGIGLIIMIILVAVVGIVMQVGVGRWLVDGIQSLLLRIPIIKTIYSPARQLFDSFTGKSDSGFKRVVIIEYPKAGTWMFGFLTATTIVDGDEFGIVYVATAPTPNSGWVAVVPIAEIHDVDMEVGDAMNLIFSGGIRAPSEVHMSAVVEQAAAAAIAESDA